MMGNLMSPTITREHGRMELLLYEEMGTVRLYLENVSREGEHWLCLASGSGHPVIGHLRLSPTADPHIFEVNWSTPGNWSTPSFNTDDPPPP